MICSIQPAKADKGASLRIVSLSRPFESRFADDSSQRQTGVARRRDLLHALALHPVGAVEQVVQIHAAAAPQGPCQSLSAPSTVRQRFDRQEKTFRKLRFFASASSDVPGSVVAIKREPSFLLILPEVIERRHALLRCRLIYWQRYISFSRVDKCSPASDTCFRIGGIEDRQAEQAR